MFAARYNSVGPAFQPHTRTPPQASIIAWLAAVRQLGQLFAGPAPGCRLRGGLSWLRAIVDDIEPLAARLFTAIAAATLLGRHGADQPRLMRNAEQLRRLVFALIKEVSRDDRSRTREPA